MVFLWIAKNPIQWFDTIWGKAYRVVGLYSLMTTARFWSWFDWHGIDGLLDGSARGVRSVWETSCTGISAGTDTANHLLRRIICSIVTDCLYLAIESESRNHRDGSTSDKFRFSPAQHAYFPAPVWRISCFSIQDDTISNILLLIVTGITAVLSFFLVVGFDSTPLAFSLQKRIPGLRHSISIIQLGLTAFQSC